LWVLNRAVWLAAVPQLVRDGPLRAGLREVSRNSRKGMAFKSSGEIDALAKLLIEKGLIYASKVYAEDFRGTGDVSEVTQSNPT
jgi:hypothetical protein